ncbi:hypothetical protein C460_13765 [Haloferax sp. ATCC BAA-646]|nr:hypothetical protein C460_13765 [Haloferax sp. ATCC BAA-646]
MSLDRERGVRLGHPAAVVCDAVCRSTASAASDSAIPRPSSATRIRSVPSPPTSISTVSAPASSAFSISSTTTLAGRATTSPAAIFDRVSGSSR